MIRVGTRVEWSFEFSYFTYAGRVRSINKHGRARVDWDYPHSIETGLVPLADLKRTSLKPAKMPESSFPRVTMDMLEGDELPALAWPHVTMVSDPLATDVTSICRRLRGLKT